MPLSPHRHSRSGPGPRAPNRSPLADVHPVEGLLAAGEPVGRPVHPRPPVRSASRVSRSSSPASRPDDRPEHVRPVRDRREDRRRPAGRRVRAPGLQRCRRASRRRTRSPRSTSGPSTARYACGAAGPGATAGCRPGPCSTASGSSSCGRSMQLRRRAGRGEHRAAQRARVAVAAAPAVHPGEEAGHRTVVPDVHHPVRPAAPGSGPSPKPADQSVSSVVVSGQRISSRVAGASTAPAGSTASGSARNAAHRAMSVGGAPQLGGRADRRQVELRFRPGRVGVRVDQVARSTARCPGATVVAVSPSGSRIRSDSTSRPGAAAQPGRRAGRGRPGPGWSSGTAGCSAAPARPGPGRRAARRRPGASSVSHTSPYGSRCRPAVCDSSRRIGQRRRARARPGARQTGSSRSSRPSSRHCSTSTAVNVLVTEPIRNRLSRVQRGGRVAGGADRAGPERAGRPGAAPPTAPGTRASACDPAAPPGRDGRRPAVAAGHARSPGQHRAERRAAEHVRVRVEDLLAAVPRRC